MSTPPGVTPTTLDVWRDVDLAQPSGSDEQAGWPLAIYIDCVTQGLDAVTSVVAPADGRIGWAWMFDPQQCPARWLPWVAQFAGVTFTTTDEETRREELAAQVGRQRGTPAWIVANIQTRLSGQKMVALVERAGGDAYRLAIRVRTQEALLTFSEMEAFVKGLIPAGIVVDFQFVTGWTFTQADDAYDSFDELHDAFTDFDDEEAGP